MRLIQLQYFVETVKRNSITKAAKNLYVSQPAISTAIHNLEEEFGITLFIRYNNQLTLTDEGHYFYIQALDLLEKAELFKANVNSFLNKPQLLKVGVPPMLGTFMVPKIVSQYENRYPNTQLQLFELGSVSVQKAISSYEIEIGLTVKHGDNLDPDLDYVVLTHTTLLFAMGAHHPLSKRQCVSVHDIKDVPLVLMKEDTLQSSLVQKAFREAGYEPNIKLRTNQLYTIKELLNKNALCAFIFKEIVQSEESIIGIPLDDSPDIEIVLAWNKNVPLSPLCRQFVDFMIEIKGLLL